MCVHELLELILTALVENERDRCMDWHLPSSLFLVFGLVSSSSSRFVSSRRTHTIVGLSLLLLVAGNIIKVLVFTQPRAKAKNRV